MEFLSLQDTPHRHFTPMSSHRMASPPDHRAHGKTGRPDASNHILRNSPPFQQGELMLPSFHQLTQSIEEPSPPQTPSRHDASMESSPVTQMPHFNEPLWQGEDSNRRRVNTVATTHRQIPYDPHRPGVVDPQLSSLYRSPRSSMAPKPPTIQQPTASQSHHHRPSLPLPQAPPPMSIAHTRHRSSPVPQDHATYQYYPGPGPPVVFPPPPTQHGPATGYYQDHRSHPHGHLCERPHDSYYPGPAYGSSRQPFGQEMYQQPQPYNYTFHSNMGSDQQFPKRRRGNLPKDATGIMKQWFTSHRDSPYPTEEEKAQLCSQTGLSLSQVSNWFINARRRAPQKEQREKRENAAADA